MLLLHSIVEQNEKNQSMRARSSRTKSVFNSYLNESGQKLTIFRAVIHKLPAIVRIAIARSPFVAIRVGLAINGGLNITPRAGVATEEFPATVCVHGNAAVGHARCIVGAVHHVRIVQQYTLIHDLPGSVLGNRCRKSNASQEGDGSKS